MLNQDKDPNNCVIQISPINSQVIDVISQEGIPY